jgi:hypothetical protein
MNELKNALKSIWDLDLDVAGNRQYDWQLMIGRIRPADGN